MHVPEEVVDNERLVAVPDSVEVHVDVVVAEEEQTEPAGQSVHRNNKQDSIGFFTQPIETKELT